MRERECERERYSVIRALPVDIEGQYMSLLIRTVKKNQRRSISIHQTE